MKRRKNQFRQALEDKREALASAAKQPKPEPEWEPETPELRAEVLADRLAEREAGSQKSRSAGVLPSARCKSWSARAVRWQT